MNIKNALDCELQPLKPGSLNPINPRWYILRDNNGQPFSYQALLDKAKENKDRAQYDQQAGSYFVTLLGEKQKIQVISNHKILMIRAQGNRTIHDQKCLYIHFPHNKGNYLMLTWSEILKINDVVDYGHDFADMLYWLKISIIKLPLTPTRSRDLDHYVKISTIRSPMELVDMLDNPNFEIDLDYSKEVLKVFNDQIESVSRLGHKEACKQALTAARDRLDNIVTCWCSNPSYQSP